MEGELTRAEVAGLIADLAFARADDAVRLAFSPEDGTAGLDLQLVREVKRSGNAVVAETEAADTVLVSFPGTRGIPQGFDGLKTRIEQILPCHLGVDYFIVYITWAEIETWFLSWTELESACADWDALEKYAQ